ncbi:MAG: sigma-70 family RNA polymerase sigma factor [Acidobacteriota bacterium]
MILDGTQLLMGRTTPPPRLGPRRLGETSDPRRAERELLRAMARGDARAFDRFVAEYTPVLVRFARNQLAGHPDAVADIVQTTLVEAVDTLDSFRGDAPLGAWLLGICRFQIGTYWRKWHVRARYAAESPVDLELIETGLPSPPEELEDDQQRAAVHGTLDLLNPPYGQVLEWKYLQELSVKEIARRLDVSPKAAESTLTRARAAFRKVFAAINRGEGGTS